jgi:hypothetical protein
MELMRRVLLLILAVLATSSAAFGGYIEDRLRAHLDECFQTYQPVEFTNAVFGTDEFGQPLFATFVSDSSAPSPEKLLEVERPRIILLGDPRIR